MRAFYQQLMDDDEEGGWQLAGNVIQSIVMVTTRVIFFPAATAIKIYKTYRDFKKYKHEINKSLGKKTSLAISLTSSVAEVIAVGALVATYAGVQLLTAGAISAIFFGSIAIQFTFSLVKTFYHAVQWAFSEAGTKKNEKHKSQCGKYFQATCVLGAIGASIGVLLVNPVYHLISLSMSMALAVKMISAAIVGINAIKTIHTVYYTHQKKRQYYKAWREKCRLAREKRIEVRKIQQDLKIARGSLLDETKEFKPNEIINLLEKLDASEYVDEPPKFNKIRPYFGPNATLRVQYQKHRPDLMKDNVHDLVRSIEANDEVDGPKKAILKLLRQSIDTILSNLAVDCELDPKTQQVELNKNNCLPVMRKNNFYLFAYQQTELQDRLHAVLLLEALIKKDKKSILKIHENNKISMIYTAYDLMQYFKSKKKIDNIFQSFFSDPKIKELFALVDYYLNHKDLHPDTRKTYENTRRYMVTPI